MAMTQRRVAVSQAVAAKGKGARQARGKKKKKRKPPRPAARLIAPREKRGGAGDPLANTF